MVDFALTVAAVLFLGWVALMVLYVVVGICGRIGDSISAAFERPISRKSFFPTPPTRAQKMFLIGMGGYCGLLVVLFVAAQIF